MSNRALLAAAAGLLTVVGSSHVSAQSFYLRHRPANRLDGSPVTVRPLSSAKAMPTDDEDDRPGPVRAKVRIANSQALARGRQFLEYGDARFRKQEFSEALQRYRKAAEAAPNLADAYFRQGLAQAALGRYQPAVNSFKRGLAIEPDWPGGEFRLRQLYGDSLAAKQMHLEQLALAAEKQPENAELMFLLGVELFFDGQPARARTFLERSAELGLEGEVVHGFLDVAARRTKGAK
ncbi:MAG TPA: tetratricopeptide repeat protein [Pirellulales bacterium]|jgi:tetratricopeptide (TPR) repeat protein|nr:tetratricopeptide repeat protein [Pirellulales bacterium]